MEQETGTDEETNEEENEEVEEPTVEEVEAKLPDPKEEAFMEALAQRLHDKNVDNLYDTIIDQVVDKTRELLPARTIVEKEIRVAPTFVNVPVLRSGDRALILTCVLILVVAPWVLSTYVFTPEPAEPPVVNVEAPEVTVNGSEIVDSLMTRRLDFDERTGLYIPLPAAADEPAQFRMACREVCGGEVRWATRFPRGRGQERTEPPEHPVLINDPTTQTCVCFSGDRVTRFVGWNRR